ncbi:nucleotide sugar dehydrogenase [Nocardia sp. NPDC052566]|uniref:nucleotide sugar dehydrogenase n=1 Tax=Nocardia sp. NPDC052566 TaxID=3364330 RepID=UPI0037C933AF
MTTLVQAAALPGTTGTLGYRIGVVGLGYAGLPQAVAFAEAGHEVVGFDVDAAVVGTLRAGRSPVGTIAHRDIERVATRLTVTDNAHELRHCTAILICVPTPVGPDDQPDLVILRAATTSVAHNLRAGQIVILESTVAPGTTAEIVKPILESTGLLAGVHFSLAFSPERIDPGNAGFNATNTPKVIGGYTSVCARRADELYRGVAPHTYVTKGLEEAEAAKVLENTYRQVNIALIHEYAAFCQARGIDVLDSINAAATKPFGFQAFYPSIGVGGHCIPVDPLYLADAARRAGTPMRMIELAHGVNTRQPIRIADQCAEALAARSGSAADCRVLVLGTTFKPDVDDIRNTPAVPLIRRLHEYGITVSIHDPFVSRLEVDRIVLHCVEDWQHAVREVDLVILGQPHSIYEPKFLREASCVLVTAGIPARPRAQAFPAWNSIPSAGAAYREMKGGSGNDHHPRREDLVIRSVHR